MVNAVLEREQAQVYDPHLEINLPALKLDDPKHNLRVMADFIADDLEDTEFDMNTYFHGDNCGTPACIAGWTHYIAARIWPDAFPLNFAEDAAFYGRELLCDDNEEMSSELFSPVVLNSNGDPLYDGIETLHDFTRADAVKVMRHYEVTGRVNWSIVNNG